MPKKCNIDNIKKELDKCEHPTEHIAMYSQIKGYISDKLKEHQEKFEAISNDIQINIDRINGN